MKKMLKGLLLVACLVGAASQVQAQKVVEYRSSQARLAEPKMGVYVKPLVADLKINDAVGKISDSWDFTNSEINALQGDIANVRTRALFKSTQKHGADVIVAASFDIKSKDDGSGYTVVVMGYPANYVNWRTSSAEDNLWIPLLNAQGTSEQTQAISK